MRLSFDTREGVMKYRYQIGFKEVPNFVTVLHEGLAIRIKHKSIKEHHAKFNSHYALLFIQLALSYSKT